MSITPGVSQSYLHIFFDYQQIIQIDADYFQNDKMQRTGEMERLEVANPCRRYSLHFSYFPYLLKSVLSVDNFQLIICVDTIGLRRGL